MTELLSSLNLPHKFPIYLVGLEFIADLSPANLLIAQGFLVCAIAANLNFKGKNIERLLCNLYACTSLICLFAGDFISMFVAIECMMLFATFIIFIGNSLATGK